MKKGAIREDRAFFFDLGVGGISVSAGVAAGGFALTASPFFKRQKGTKRLCPGVRHFAEAQCSLATVSIRGIAYGWLRCTSSRCMRLRRTALRAYPLMNTFARPAEEVGTARSRAKAKAKAKSKDRSLRQFLQGDWLHSVRTWSADRPPSRASPLPQLDRLHPVESGRLRPPSQASRIVAPPLPQWDWAHSVRKWSAFRPPSRAGEDLQFLICVQPKRRSRPTQQDERKLGCSS
jgi:hypothetical protein